MAEEKRPLRVYESSIGMAKFGRLLYCSTEMDYKKTKNFKKYAADTIIVGGRVIKSRWGRPGGFIWGKPIGLVK